MKEPSFAALFRQSPLARFNPKLQCVRPSAQRPPAPNSDSNISSDQRPPRHYGLKYDPPARLWGRPLNNLRLRRGLDGDYQGLGLVEHCNLQPLRSRLLSILKRVKIGGGGEGEGRGGGAQTTGRLRMPADIAGPNTNDCAKELSHGQCRDEAAMVHMDKRIAVLARLLTRTSTGFSMSVAGLTAHMPFLEIPKHCQFSMEDVVRKRVFRVFVKEVIAEKPDAGPRIILSFRDSQ